MRGLRARGGFEVGIEWKAGAPTRATILSTLGDPCRVRATVPLTVTAQGRPVPVTHPEPNVVEFKTTAGASYVLAAVAGSR